MLGLPEVELAVRVRSLRRPWSSLGRVRLRRRAEPLARRGHVWQVVVDLDVGYPALVDVLATCHGFRVDDDHGNTVGEVAQVVIAPESPQPVGVIVRSWQRRRIAVPLDDIVEVVPGGRRLVTASRSGRSR